MRQKNSFAYYTVYIRTKEDTDGQFGVELEVFEDNLGLVAEMALEKENVVEITGVRYEDVTVPD